MEFDVQAYGAEVAELLALDGAGRRLMPLAEGKCSSTEALARLRGASAQALFPDARSPNGALAGLWLYFSCLDEAHEVAQGLATTEGSFWHGIMHRQEPDAWNSAYWFRRAGRHEIFPALHVEAANLLSSFPNAGYREGAEWDPFRFIDFVELARKTPGSEAEKLALEIQRAEWQLLFDYCAGRRR
jgi:hypothetical protein